MLRLALAAVLTVGLVSGASAQNLDVIEKRKEAFKSLLPHVKAGKAMVQGTADFDLEKAKAIYASYAKIAKDIPDLFPADSKEGGKTEALPIIWEQKDDFTGRFEKFVQEANAASEEISDYGSFRASWGKVMGNCGACHKVYRVDKN